MHEHRCKRLPFLARRSVGFSVDVNKGNNQKSAAGSRLIHCLCPFYRARFRNSFHKKKSSHPPWPGHAYGGVPKKRREGAMLVTRLLSHQLQKSE